MSLVKLLGEQFLVTLFCIGPASICFGAILIVPFALFLKLLDLDSLKKRKGIKIEPPEWLITLGTYFPMGFVSFPLARLIFGLEIFKLEWNLWSYFIITSSLGIFALVFAFLIAFASEHAPQEKMSEKASMLVVLGSYAGGMLVGVLVTWFYFP